MNNDKCNLCENFTIFIENKKVHNDLKDATTIALYSLRHFLLLCG